MRRYFDKSKRWLMAQTDQQRQLTLLVLLALIWLIWASIFSINSSDQQRLNNEISAVQAQLASLSQQINALRQTITTANSAQQIAQLQKQLQLVNQKLATVSQQIVSPEQMLTALKAIINQDPDLKLQLLQNGQSTPIQILTKEESKQNINNYSAGSILYKHNFIIQFSGNYFATLRYLQRLEKLPWRIYWDTMDYHVDKYPIANVSITFHIISSDEGLING